MVCGQLSGRRLGIDDLLSIWMCPDGLWADIAVRLVSHKTCAQ
jgi:hypothetical protein